MRRVMVVKCPIIPWVNSDQYSLFDGSYATVELPWDGRDPRGLTKRRHSISLGTLLREGVDGNAGCEEEDGVPVRRDGPGLLHYLEGREACDG